VRFGHLSLDQWALHEVIDRLTALDELEQFFKLLKLVHQICETFLSRKLQKSNKLLQYAYLWVVALTVVKLIQQSPNHVFAR